MDGLPIVTLCGDRAVSRQTNALIGTIGRTDWLRLWVADDLDAYVEKAVILASAPDRLMEIRSCLRAVMKPSPLVNGRQFAKDFEDVILKRWSRDLVG